MLVGVSFRKHKGNLPAGATCSAVVSAACHRPVGDKEAHLFPVIWGEVTEQEGFSAKHSESPQVSSPRSIQGLQQSQAQKQSPQRSQVEIPERLEQGSLDMLPIIRHCCFTTAATVESPTKGHLYK
jgi:hypothetical protein